MGEISGPLTVMLAGLAGGLVLGLAARLGRFCTLGAIEDVLLAGNSDRLRMWVLAMGVAVLGTAALTAFALVDTSQNFLIERPLNLVTLVLGGLLFGFGMALVGTCGFGTLVRLGGGDMKSFVVFLVIGISAYMAAAGPTALLRQALLDDFAMDAGWLSSPLLGPILEAQFGLPAVATALLVGLALVGWALGGPRFRSSPRAILVGLIVGLVIVWGWVATGYLGADPFEPAPVGSYTFIRSLGASVLYLMASSGTEVGFGVGGALGVIVGSCLAAHWKREFRWEASDDVVEQQRQIVGAFLMGTGGMFALGCTIGQGLTAVSILALSAPIVLGAIWVGAWLGLNYIVEGTLTGALRAWLENGNDRHQVPGE